MTDIKRSNLLLTGSNFSSRTQNTIDLQAAIQAAGNVLLQPLVVTPDGAGKFIVLAGHRRMVATHALGLYLDTLPCSIIDVPEKEQGLFMLAANVQKPASLEEKLYWVRRLGKQGISVSKQAKAMGVSVTTIWRLNKLLAAAANVREAVLEGRLSLRLFESISTKPKAEQSKIVETAMRRKSPDRTETPITRDALMNARRTVEAETQPDRIVGDVRTLAERLNAILSAVRAEGKHLPYSNRERAIVSTILPKITEALGGLKGETNVS